MVSVVASKDSEINLNGIRFIKGTYQGRYPWGLLESSRIPGKREPLSQYNIQNECKTECIPCGLKKKWTWYQRRSWIRLQSCQSSLQFHRQNRPLQVRYADV